MPKSRYTPEPGVEIRPRVTPEQKIPVDRARSYEIREATERLTTFEKLAKRYQTFIREEYTPVVDALEYSTEALRGDEAEWLAHWKWWLHGNNLEAAEALVSSDKIVQKELDKLDQRKRKFEEKLEGFSDLFPNPVETALYWMVVKQGL